MIDKKLAHVRKAMAKLVKRGWVITRTELTSDISDGEQLVIVLRYESLRTTDIL